jgi:hypothetical protein
VWSVTTSGCASSSASETTYSPSAPPKPPEDPRRAHVVAANRLRDHGHEAGPLRPRRLVDDDHALDPLDPVEAEQRGAHVGGEGADAAGARRIGGNDRGSHRARVPSAGVRRGAVAPIQPGRCHPS